MTISGSPNEIAALVRELQRRCTGIKAIKIHSLDSYEIAKRILRANRDMPEAEDRDQKGGE